MAKTKPAPETALETGLKAGLQDPVAAPVAAIALTPLFNGALRIAVGDTLLLPPDDFAELLKLGAVTVAVDADSKPAE